MGLVLQYTKQNKSGRWEYRRRVPKAVAKVITKGEFKRVLGDDKREALKAYPQFHAEVEREIAKALATLEQGSAADRGDVTEREAYKVALARVEEMRASKLPAAVREAIIEEIVNRYSVAHDSHDEPENATAVDRHTINILRNGADRSKRPEPTLEDAKKLYIKEKLGGGEAVADRRSVNRMNRVIGMVSEALGRDPVLSSITREEAREVRDHMLGRVKSTGEKISPASVSRELNTIKAVVNFAIAEMTVPATYQNPFNKLTVTALSGSPTDSRKRDPLPPNVLKEVRERVGAHAASDLALIWRLLEGTGCRLAEVTGLRVEDVETTGEHPHIKVEWHESRRVKTQSSIRFVPLVGDALEAAKEAVELPREGDMLFPKYGRHRGADAASAILMKHLRRVTTNSRHVVHSLRHNLKDWLREAEVSSLDQNLILGHALGGVGDRVYGGSPAKLRVTTRAMKKAHEVAAQGGLGPDSRAS